MSHQQQGTLTVSVDLPIGEHDTLASRQGAQQLLELMNELKIPATWAVSSLADPFVNSILHSSQSHEVGLLSTHVTSPDITRRQAARHLVRTRIAAASAGIDVTTLALVGPSLDDRLELLMRHPFSMVRARLDATANQTLVSAPQFLRYGIWLTPVSSTLPQVDRAGLLGQVSKLPRTLRAAARSSQFMHLGVDAAKVGQFGSGKLRRIFRRVTKLRERGQLRCLTLQQVANALRERGQTSRGGRSVLRAA